MLEMALVNWTLSEVTKRGFTPLTTPEIVRASVVEKCGFQPWAENTQVCQWFSFVMVNYVLHIFPQQYDVLIHDFWSA